MWMMYDKT